MTQTDVATQDEDGRTALHLAAMYGHDNVVEMLLEAKADLSTQDKWGRTVLHMAAENGYDKVVKMLEANTDICDKVIMRSPGDPILYTE